jgi:hypothetical protein
VSNNSRAYNSVWQLRGDAWCRLEEASDRLTKPTTSGELKDEYVTIEMSRPANAPIGNGHRPLAAESPEPAVDADTSQSPPRKTGAKKAGKPPEPAQTG